MWRKSSGARVWCFCDGSTGALYAAQRLAEAPVAPLQVVTAEKRELQPNRGLGAKLVCAAAAVARADDGTILGWEWEGLPAMTNNEAEYAGLLLGLKLAQRLQTQEVVCVMDSEVVVGQMEGRYAVNSAQLRQWHWRACTAARRLPTVHYRLVPREWNRLADGLAGQASVPWAALVKVLREGLKGVG